MTNEEKRSISFFHFERGDMTRYVRWEEMYDDLSKNHPELLEAYDKYIHAKRYLDFIVKSECEEDE